MDKIFFKKNLMKKLQIKTKTCINRSIWNFLKFSWEWLSLKIIFFMSLPLYKSSFLISFVEYKCEVKGEEPPNSRKIVVELMRICRSPYEISFRHEDAANTVIFADLSVTQSLSLLLQKETGHCHVNSKNINCLVYWSAAVFSMMLELIELQHPGLHQEGKFSSF